MSSLSEDGRQPASAEVSGEGYLWEEMMHLRGPRLAGWAHWQREKRGGYERWWGGGGADEVGTWGILKMRKKNDGELNKDLWNGTGEWSEGGEVWISRSSRALDNMSLFELDALNLRNKKRKKGGWTHTDPRTGRKDAAILLWLLAAARTITLREAVFIHQTDYSVNQALTTTSIIMDSSCSCRKIKNITHLFVVICCHGCSYVSVC